MSLSVDLWKLRQDLEDSQNRLDCLKECHLLESPQDPLPDFVFPLQRVLLQALEEIQALQEAKVRPEVRQAVQELVEDPQAQVLMELLAQAEAQERALAEVLAAELVLALAEVPVGVQVQVLELAQAAVQVKE